MKGKKLLLLLFLLVSFLLVFGSCATDKMGYISKDYEIYGTWVNPDYEDARVWNGKMIIYPNGSLVFYKLISDTKSNKSAEFVITNKWFDSNGTAWHTFILKFTATESYYNLAKISNDGKTMEFSMSVSDYPKMVDPIEAVASPNYAIYNRK